jgi:hypothetical protein
MNTMMMAIVMIAGSLFFFTSPLNDVPKIISSTQIQTTVTHNAGKEPWEQNAIQWLVDAQSPNGGWGAGSHAYQNIRDPHQVQTDPATTSFAGLALLKAGGPLDKNPYKIQIMKALDRILQDIESRPDNGRITSLDGTQPQVKLGIHIDASMALQFLTDMRKVITDPALQNKIDKAAQVCVDLIQGSQNANGGWAGGGWAPVLQSAMANNALERAQERYKVDEKALENSRKYQAGNIGSGEVVSGDAAGVPLYAVASAQRATAAEAKETMDHLPDAVIESYAPDVSEETVVRDLASTGMAKDKALRLAKSYVVNQSSSRQLQDDRIWDGFGNNGGEEYLSYLLTSEALAQQNKDEWMKWIQTIEPKFKQSQNPNGSWSGHHCITSPVFCTAAILQALNVRG